MKIMYRVVVEVDDDNMFVSEEIEDLGDATRRLQEEILRMDFVQAIASIFRVSPHAVGASHTYALGPYVIKKPKPGTEASDDGEGTEASDDGEG